MDINSMGRMSDMEQICPQFVMSAYLEEDFKPFLDEVMKKTVLNGDQVPMEMAKTEKSNRNKLISLYRTFFFGESISDLEYGIERDYIGEKIEKDLKFEQSKV